MKTFGALLGVCAACFAAVTVVAVPWLLGGVVPLARVILLTGAVLAGVLSVLAQLCSGKTPQSLPIVMVPLAALALLGMWQLRPADQDPAAHLQHTLTQTPADMVINANPAASFIPADTRSMAATLLGTAILSLVVFNHVRTRRSLILASALIAVNAITLTVIGFTQLFHGSRFSLNEFWTLSRGAPFATFVNPNNAAGWLCLSFSIVTGWLAFQLKAASTDERQRIGKLKIPLWERCWQRSIQFLADLNIWQVLAFVAVAFLGAGVAATRSRGGILALVIGIVLTLVAHSSIKRLPLVALVLAVGGAGIYGLLNSLEMDESVLAEMRTLEDLDEAAGSRPQHWLDSLQAARDAPLTGTGLGSYRSATLPYQTQPTNIWFQNADNYFVDVIVEGGLVGFLLFLSIGVCALITGVAGWRQSRKRMAPSANDAPRISRRLTSAAGTTVVLATLTQTVSGLFDFGVAMPAAIVLFIVIVSAAAGLFDAAEPAARVMKSGSIVCGRPVVIAVQLCLVCATAAFIPDQKAAAEIDPIIVSGKKLLFKPVTPEKLDAVPANRKLLTATMRFRPDDPEGWRMLWKLASAEFRWNVLLKGQGDAIRDAKQFDTQWRKTSIFWLANELAKTAAQDPAAAKQTRIQLRPILLDAGLPVILRSLQQRFPIMPNVAAARAELAVLVGDDALFEQQVAQARFVEPSNPDVTFRLGQLALNQGKRELAVQLWQTCVLQSNRFRGVILIEARTHWSEDEAMTMFGPNTYTESVQSARTCNDSKLRAKLFDRAESLWPSVEDASIDEIASLRAVHLSATKRPDEAIEWLEGLVKQSANSDRIEIRKQLAQLQQQQSKFADALQQWRAILYLDPNDAQARAAITKLQSMKSPE